jgi:hypothetical protein
MDGGRSDVRSSLVCGEDCACDKRPFASLVLGVEFHASAPHPRRREFGNDLAQARTTRDFQINVTAVSVTAVNVTVLSIMERGQRVVDGQAHPSNVVERGLGVREEREAR